MSEHADRIRMACEFAMRQPDDTAGFIQGRDGLAALAELERELGLAKEEIRLREESQIPVIPRVAQARIDSLERELKEARQAAKDAEWRAIAECNVHGGFDPDQRGPGICPYCNAEAQETLQRALRAERQLAAITARFYGDGGENG